MSIHGFKGGSKGRTPVEGADSLRSTTVARIIDLLSEGEVEGLVDGLRSVYLDETPVQNQDGTLNFKGFNVELRKGTQAQTHMPGFASVENSVQVGVEIRRDASITRQFSNPNIDAVRLTLSTPTLVRSNKENGDTFGTEIRFQVQMQSNGGGFVAAPLSYTPTALSSAGGSVNGSGQQVEAVITSGSLRGDKFEISVDIVPAVATAYWQCKYALYYREVGASTWVLHSNRDVSRRGLSTSQSYGSMRDSLAESISIRLPSAQYQFRAVLLETIGGFNSGALAPIAASIRLGGTGYIPNYIGVISGKTSTKYQRSYRIDLQGDAPWDIRIIRETADSSSQYLQNKLYLDTTTEIIDAKLRYPNSAYAAITVDASQFSSVPTRSYHMRGIRVRVPSNYDPVRRTYAGAWDGSFKIAWTDNPAWCYYDLLTNTRYGLGELVQEATIDKWGLYTIGKYCDELVPDGNGGMEPRFTCNLYLKDRREAYRVLSDMASIFRGMSYLSSGSIATTQDAPSDPVYLYTPANVIEGKFNYTGSSLKTRHTVALVSWNDPEDFYREKIEYVEDQEGILKRGVLTTELIAVGCSSRGQAHRLGKWALLSERLLSEVVTFKTGLDGNLARPGQVIKIADPARSGVRMGGRIAAGSVNGVSLDAPVTLVAGQTYTLSTLNEQGEAIDRTVTNQPGETSTISVSPAFENAPEPGSIWILASQEVEPQLFRVISVAEAGKMEFEITALEHVEGKFDLVENGIELQKRQYSLLNSVPIAPRNGQMSESQYEAATDMKTVATFSWDAVPGAKLYRASYRRELGNPVGLPEAQVPSFVLQDALPGKYEVTVNAVNHFGTPGPSYTFEAEVLGKIAPPANIAGLQLQVQTSGAIIGWKAVPDMDVRIGGKVLIRHSTSLTNASWSTAVPMAEFSGSSTSGVVPLLTGTYFAKAEDSSGVQSVAAASVITTSPELIQYNAVVTRYEQPAFAGAKSGLTVSGGELRLGESATWDDIANFDEATSIDGETIKSGSYEFSTPIDIAGVYTCRLTADIEVDSYDVYDPTMASINESVDTSLLISTTEDDPTNPGANWSEYKPFVVGTYTARGYKFKLEISRGDSPAQQVRVKRLGVTIDVPDRVEAGNAVTVPAAGLDVAFLAPFFDVPAVAITASQMATGDYYEVTNKTSFGFKVQFFNASGVPISKQMDWIAKGFGYKT